MGVACLRKVVPRAGLEVTTVRWGKQWMCEASVEKGDSVLLGTWRGLLEYFTRCPKCKIPGT